jgi:hypothetical protein
MMTYPARGRGCFILPQLAVKSRRSGRQESSATGFASNGNMNWAGMSNHSGISEMSTRLRQVGRDSGDGADFVVARLVSELGLAESL